MPNPGQDDRLSPQGDVTVAAVILNTGQSASDKVTCVGRLVFTSGEERAFYIEFDGQSVGYGSTQSVNSEGVRR